MGETPEEFCRFWTSRFPRLLVHSWYAMHCVKNEHIFSRYYDKQYDFLQVTCFKDYYFHHYFTISCIHIFIIITDPSFEF